jgi:hypothetical protein
MGKLASIKWLWKLYNILDNVKKGGAMKAGIATTEFWVTLISTLIGLGIASGFVPGDFPKDDATTATTHIAGAVVAIVAIFKYLHSRTEIKKAAINNPVPPVVK